MKVKLTLNDRFALHSVLPQEAHILELKAMELLRAGLLPDAKEQQEIGMIINPQGQPQWPKDKELKLKVFEVNEIVFDIVRKTLKALEEKGKTREGHLKIYSIFVENDFEKGKGKGKER